MSFDLYQKRLADAFAQETNRIDQMKLESFKNALGRVYNTETFYKGETENKVILSDGESLTILEDDKMISALNSSTFAVGDTLKWEANNTYWLVVAKRLSEKTYFIGEIRKANYQINWRDENGIIYSAWAALKNVSNNDAESAKSDFVYLTDSSEGELWISDSEGTKCLKKYGKLMVANKVWEIKDLNSYSIPGICILTVKKDMTDSNSDNVEDNIARDKVKFEIKSIFDQILEVQQNQLISVDFEVFKDGLLNNELKSLIVVDMGTSENTYINSNITFGRLGANVITVSIPSVGYSKTYTINVVSSIVPIEKYIISGEEVISPLELTQIYTIKKNINGVTQPTSDGNWVVDPTFASIQFKNADTATIVFNGQMGLTKVQYFVNDIEVINKEVKIVSLFG